MGTSGSSYPSKICKDKERSSLDDDIILSPGDYKPELEKILTSRSTRRNNSKFFVNQELNGILNDPNRFDYNNSQLIAKSGEIEDVLKLGLYSYFSTEYAKYKAIIIGLRFLSCLSKKNDLNECFGDAIISVASEMVKSQISVNIDEISDYLFDNIEDDFTENGISPEYITPIRFAFEYSIDKAIEKITDKTVDEGVDISYEFLNDFMTDVDVRCSSKEATSGSKHYKSASLRYGYTLYDHEHFVPQSKLSNYKNQLAEKIKIRNQEQSSKIYESKSKILGNRYHMEDYLKDVGNHVVRTSKNIDIKPIPKNEFKQEKITKNKFCKGQKESIELKDFNELFDRKLLPTVLEDILTISQKLIYFDTNVKRGTLLTIDRKYPITISTPLADYWNIPNIKHKLQRTIYELMQENIIIEFEKIEKSIVPIPDNFDKNKIVCLFSGGLDSFSGAIDLLRNSDLEPYFLSLRPKTNLKTIQNNLMKELSIYFNKELNSVEYIYVTNSKISAKDRYYHPTQRSRSFLFLSVAIVYAICNGARKIHIPENGIIALFDEVPFIESESFTRTVHPDFISAFNDLVREMVDEKLEIENPFEFNTKTEIINKILENANQEFAFKTIKSTESCSNQYFRTNKKFSVPYCGVCTPCIMKSLSLMASNVDYKKIGKPKNDVFNLKFFNDNDEEELDQKGNNELPRFKGELTLRDLFYLAGKINLLSHEEVIHEYPKLRNIHYYKLFKKFSDELLSIQLDTIDYPKFNELKEKVIS